MKRVTDHIREHLLSRVSLAPVGQARESLDQLSRTQWSDDFEHAMRVRLLMGRYRYGAMRQQAPNGYDNVGSARQRLALYQATGNLEHLVDAANLCLVEFVTGRHPHRHFDASDDGIHTEKLPCTNSLS